MLSQGQSLLAVLVLVYLSDCFYWCRLTGLVFSASRFTNWTYKRPQGLLANQKGGLVLLPVLPPLGWSHLAAPRPFILSPMGVCFAPEAGLSDRPDAGEPVALCDLAALSAHGHEIYLDKEKVAEAPDCRSAQRWVKQCHSLVDAQDPAADIRSLLKAEFNLEEIAGSQLKAYQSVKSLRIANMMLFMVMFIFVPFMSWLLGLGPTILLSLALIFIAVVANAVMFYRAHARLLPDEKWSRIGQVLIQLVSWPMATRGADVLTRNTFATYHPLAVASILLPPETFQATAAAWYRRLKHPHSSDAPGSLQRNWHAAALAEVMDERLPARGWDGQAALQAPAAEADERSYCPRCHALYIIEQGTCAACVETALLPLPQPKET